MPEANYKKSRFHPAEAFFHPLLLSLGIAWYGMVYGIVWDQEQKATLPHPQVYHTKNYHTQQPTPTNKIIIMMEILRKHTRTPPQDKLPSRALEYCTVLTRNTRQNLT